MLPLTQTNHYWLKWPKSTTNSTQRVTCSCFPTRTRWHQRMADGWIVRRIDQWMCNIRYWVFGVKSLIGYSLICCLNIFFTIDEYTRHGRILCLTSMHVMRMDQRILDTEFLEWSSWVHTVGFVVYYDWRIYMSWQNFVCWRVWFDYENYDFWEKF